MVFQSLSLYNSLGFSRQKGKTLARRHVSDHVSQHVPRHVPSS